MKIREVTSTLVQAPRDEVYACLESKGTDLAPDGALTRVANERLEVRPPGGRAASWFHLQDAPGGATRIIHGTALDPRNFLDGVIQQRNRKHIRRHLEEDLREIKALAEGGHRHLPMSGHE